MLLARVLTQESEVVIICASATDIKNKYMGETKKTI